VEASVNNSSVLAREGQTPASEIQTDTLSPICPIDLTAGRPVAVAAREDVLLAVQKSQRAQKTWRNVPLNERADLLRKAAKAMLARRHELMVMVREEIGKVDAEAIFNESLGPLDTVNGWISVVKEHASRCGWRHRPLELSRRGPVPLGVPGTLAGQRRRAEAVRIFALLQRLADRRVEGRAA
jgi:acyl-CoA reductase-like NAD-dependent aldehyde dehydrogenase